ncbi:MAG: helix-turn-helix transcriptional regulator [Pirellula sp.]|jgi:excisionase family DNA binding protein
MSSKVVDGVTDGQGRTMLSVTNLAKRWGCSERHVRRMVDAGRCPRPIKFGSLLRFPVAVIEQWENDGCPHVRNIAKGGK